MTKAKKRVLIASIVIALLAVVCFGVISLADSSASAEISYCNIAYKSNVHIKFALKVENLPEGAEMGVRVREASVDSETVYEADYDGKTTIAGEEYHVFGYAGLSAVEMTVDIYATPYVKQGETEIYVGTTKKCSILEYAYRTLGKIGDGEPCSETTATLLNALLKYGAAVQTYRGKNTERLADAQYYYISAVGGSLADGTEGGLYLPGDTVTFTANVPEGYKFLRWENSAGTSLGNSESIEVEVAAASETYTAVYVIDNTKIYYELYDGTLPAGDWDNYEPGTAFALPTPTKDGYVFSGWFTSSDFNIKNITTEVPADAVGPYTVYAKWNKIVSDLDGSEIYASGKWTDNSSTANTREVATDGSLLWTQGTAQASQIIMSGNIVEGTENNKQFTYNVTLSKGEGAIQAITFRLRRAGTNSYIYLFGTDTEGNVYLGNNTAYKIGTITATPTTFRIVVDFETETFTAYNEKGRQISCFYFSLPSGDKDSYTYETWYNSLTSIYWLIYSYADSAGTMNVHNVSLHAGNSAIRVEGRGISESELSTRLDELKQENAGFSVSDFDSDTQGTYTVSDLTDNGSGVLIYPITASQSWLDWSSSANSKYLVGARNNGTASRLIINEDIIASILANQGKEEYKYAYNALLQMALTECDGILGEPQENFDERKGYHNFSKSTLGIIEAKALMYRLMYEQGYADGTPEAMERDIYGYEAIIAMKNFLTTLDIQYISSDQCREYGYAMYTAAEVYDWCYPLLTAEDKEQLIFGVVENCCAGYCGDPSYTSTTTYKRKMEVGFPPSNQGSVSGHGSEAQVLRDYLSFALAIYDEDPSWWQYIAARVIGDYAAVRSVYFQSGMTQQGVSNYVGHRHYSDLYSGWIMQVATGENPFAGMENTVISIFGYQLPSVTGMFGDGDGAISPALSKYTNHALIASALYSSSEYGTTSDTLFSWFTYLKGGEYRSFSSGQTTGITYANFLIFASQGQTVVEDKYADLNLIQYNGSPLGVLISRSEWNNANAAATYMKIGERTTANHEHQDAGTFQIYYKGLLTSDSGIYNVYGSTQHKYYHKATVSHNGLLIFNPSRYDSTDADKKWYSGGQKALGEATTLSAWQSETYTTGEVTGVQYGYKDEAKTKASYAYIAGDITAAYYADTVDYVGRRMLTVYTDDESFPMYFFVFDSITSDDASFEKTFLLHIRGEEAPAISGNTVTTDNGKGKLVLHSLSDGVTIEAIGGRVYNSAGKLDAANSSNYMINGVQCAPESATGDDSCWGRVEISTSGTKSSTFMNAMYVTDVDSTATAPTVSKIAADGVEGAMIGNVAAVFSTSKDRTKEPMSFKTAADGDVTYYISGVAAGDWTIRVDGTKTGTATATADGGMLVFTAAAGDISLTYNEILFENYVSTSVDTVAANGPDTQNGIRYATNDYASCSYQTKTDTDGSKYLLLTTDEESPVFRASANLYSALGGETTVSFRLKLAAVSGKNPVALSWRIRDNQSTNKYKVVFALDASGNIRLGSTTGTVVDTVDSSGYTTVRVAVDFASSTIKYYDEDGTVLGSVTFAPASGGGDTTAEWLTMMTKYYFDCQGVSSPTGELKIGEIGVYAGNIYE